MAKMKELKSKNWVCKIEKHSEGDIINCIHKKKGTSINLFKKELRGLDLYCDCDKSGNTQCFLER